MKTHQKILIVDDEADFRIPLAKIISRRGLTVDTAESCSKAMAKMTADPFDVIVMDVSMPEISGIHCLMLIKQEWPSAEVIILTGHASVNSGIEGMKGGAFDYCLKPIDTNELLEKIELACEKVRITRDESFQP
ncbi:MAG: response regulator [Proteobacteria bacterium]|nr:response regulator [Pseudomonadota bacterium]MBU1232872.1 response regulator [Pseudomonadota bacterium]MBU1418445.1 response regulator [Pseudomonadota bacterium]MBU1456463.1 response regulator [Pseudomonadota bacterium]